MPMKRIVLVLIRFLLPAALAVAGDGIYSGGVTYESYEGLLMAGSTLPVMGQTEDGTTIGDAMASGQDRAP